MYLHPSLELESPSLMRPMQVSIYYSGDAFDELWYCGKDMGFRIKQIKIRIPTPSLTSLGKSRLYV